MQLIITKVIYKIIVGLVLAKLGKIDEALS